MLANATYRKLHLLLTFRCSKCYIIGMKKFHEYFESLDSDNKVVLAKQAGTSVAYLRQISQGRRNAGASLINSLIEAGRKDIAKMIYPKWFEKGEFGDQAA